MGGAVLALALVGGGLAATVLGGEDSPQPETAPSPQTAPSPETTPSPDYTYQLPKTIREAGVLASQAGCSEVETPKDQGSHQVETGEKHPPYSSTPPTSGWYRLGSLTPALYYVPTADNETLVRNMAEGDVIIWHTGLSKGELEDLKGLMVLLKSEQLLGVPGKKLGLEEKIVLTAWGRLQRCEELSGEAIEDFFERFRGQGPLS